MTNLIARLRANYEAMLGPDYFQAATALEAQEANAKQLADTIRDMHAAGLELRQRAEQAERALASVHAGLELLLAAVNADDPKREILVRIGDLMRDAQPARAFVAQHGSDSREGK